MSQGGEAAIGSSDEKGWKSYAFIQSWGQAWNSSVVGNFQPFQGIFNKASAYWVSFIVKLVVHHDDIM